MEEPKRGRGRPPVPPDKELVSIGLRGTVALKAKVKRNGQVWARKVLEKAPDPKKPPP